MGRGGYRCAPCDSPCRQSVDVRAARTDLSEATARWAHGPTADLRRDAELLAQRAPGPNAVAVLTDRGI